MDHPPRLLTLFAPPVARNPPPALDVAYAASRAGRLRGPAGGGPLTPQRRADPYRAASGTPPGGAVGSYAAQPDRGGDRPAAHSAGDAHADRGRGRTAFR